MLPSRSIGRAVAARIVWACVVAYLAMTAIFVLIVQTPDRERGAIKWAAARQGEVADLPPVPPISEQYVDWLTSFLAFEWGTSTTAAQRISNGRAAEPAPNVEAILEAAPVTLAYVVPSAAVAFLLAVGLGYYAARRPRSWATRLSSQGSYVAFSLPNFFLALLAFHTLRDLDPGWFPSSYEAGAGVSWSNLLWLSLPALVLTTHLTAGFFRYTRAETREALHERFVTLARAKGAGPRRIARHVLRTAALPLVTLFVTELIGVLLVAVFVIEVVFEVPGVGLLAYEGIRGREIELVMVLTMLFSLVCVLANLVQDVAAVTLDARVDR